MIENQNVEFKTIWKDEWLKWVCGMANSNGGIIYIGVDDSGEIVGVNNVSKLVKEIPNKIKDTMGIIPEVKVEEKNGLSYITINVEKYPVPISYQGKLYLRSGSNNNEVTGIELERFMLLRAGKRWEDFPVVEATLEDLSQEALNYFREKAIKSGRLKKEDLDIDNLTLLKKLGLYNGQYLNRAALLLFGKEPNRWVVGSIIKIGFFEKDNADLKYQDEVEGPILLQVDKALDLLYLKYFKGLIWYKDIQRIDEYIIPREACREILLNCINHKRYESNIPIQISVYNDKVYIWNDGDFPKEINKEKIYQKHISKPYNPLIAQTFFKAGFIESWGRGFEKIENECKDFNCPLPDVKINEGGVMIECNPSENYLKILKDMNLKNEKNTVNDTVNDTLNDTLKNILHIIQNNKYATQVEIAYKLDVSIITVKRNIAKLKEDGYIKRIGADKNGYWEILKEI